MSIEQGIPKVKSIGDIKSFLLNPATTSHFYVHLNLPANFSNYLIQNKVNYDAETLSLMCCEATLPGSNMATMEINGDFHGVTERHAYRRVYDDRIDLTYYVDAQNYTSIRLFEVWMKYIAQEAADTPQADKSPNENPITKLKGSTSRSFNYFYRFNYPDNYMSNDMIITKFERSSPLKSIIPGKSILSSGGGFLTYNFYRCFPISLSSMPVSYDSSQLLKCTVSMSYIRYVMDTAMDPPPSVVDSNGSIRPADQLSASEQALYNSVGNNLTGTGALTTITGTPQSPGNTTVSGFTVGANSNIA